LVGLSRKKAMKKILVLIPLLLSACNDPRPISWMYAEHQSLQTTCTDDGRKLLEKTMFRSVMYTWTCSYPKNFSSWQQEFELFVKPKGWRPGRTLEGYDWVTYCHDEKLAEIRLVKVDAKRAQEPKDRLWITLVFPADSSECR
jgi:hypothetical protein